MSSGSIGLSSWNHRTSGGGRPLATHSKVIGMPSGARTSLTKGCSNLGFIGTNSEKQGCEIFLVISFVKVNIVRRVVT